MNPFAEIDGHIDKILAAFENVLNVYEGQPERMSKAIGELGLGLGFLIGRRFDDGHSVALALAAKLGNGCSMGINSK